MQNHFSQRQFGNHCWRRKLKYCERPPKKESAFILYRDIFFSGEGRARRRCPPGNVNFFPSATASAIVDYMSATLRVDETETLMIPGTLLPTSTPGASYEVQVLPQGIVLSPKNESEHFWKTATKEEWLTRFSEWVQGHKGGPGLSDAATSRASIYE
jgi:hypothetical protein